MTQEQELIERLREYGDEPQDVSMGELAEWSHKAADMIEALSQQLEKAREVKPLVWKHRDGNYPKWEVLQEPVWGGTFTARIDKGEACPALGRFPLFINGSWDGKKHQNLKSAKAAAQADYQRRYNAMSQEGE